MVQYFVKLIVNSKGPEGVSYGRRTKIILRTADASEVQHVDQSSNGYFRDFTDS
jgi:hypothetical protein